MSKKGFAKILLSALLLFIVFRSVDFSKLSGIVTEISPSLVVTVVVGYALGQFLSSFKWWNIARAAGIDVPYAVVLRAYFIGMFVNCFGLGMVGGDVTRGILIARGKPMKVAGVSTVIADRIHGLAILALIGTIAVLILGRLTLPTMLAWTLGLGSIAVVVGWFIGPAILLKLIRPGNRWRVRAEQVSNAFPRSPSVICFVTAISIAFHITQISLHWVMGRCVGVDIPWEYIWVIVPFVNIFSSLPISWNGLGVREKSYIFFLTPAILSSEQAVAFSAIWLLAIIVSSAIGGLVAFLTEDLSFAKIAKEKQELEKEQAQAATRV